jgi:hypothetical protein
MSHDSAPSRVQVTADDHNFLTAIHTRKERRHAQLEDFFYSYLGINATS